MHVYLTKWRLKQGLRWQRHYPDPAPALANLARGCAMAAVLIVVYGLVGRLEYQQADAAETEARQTIERTIAARNLEQAESLLTACFDHDVLIVGTAIYRCKAVKSEMTTADVPELKSNNTPGAGG
jgi:hypothetical protein